MNICRPWCNCSNHLCRQEDYIISCSVRTHISSIYPLLTTCSDHQYHGPITSFWYSSSIFTRLFAGGPVTMIWGEFSFSPFFLNVLERREADICLHCGFALGVLLGRDMCQIPDCSRGPLDWPLLKFFLSWVTGWLLTGLCTVCVSVTFICGTFCHQNRATLTTTRFSGSCSSDRRRSQNISPYLGGRLGNM